MGCVHSNGITFPWKMTYDQTFSEVAAGGNPGQVWDNIPEAAKWQIILVVGFFEWWSENTAVLSNEGQSHYMRGGKPGYFPTFDMIPHPVPLNLWDPFGFTKKLSAEQKARK